MQSVCWRARGPKSTHPLGEVVDRVGDVGDMAAWHPGLEEGPATGCLLGGASDGVVDAFPPLVASLAEVIHLITQVTHKLSHRCRGPHQWRDSLKGCDDDPNHPTTPKSALVL
jgi:hypothetical protein